MYAQLSVYVPLVFTIVGNNGIMVIPSLPHGSTKTILMRDYQSKNIELGPYFDAASKFLSVQRGGADLYACAALIN